MVPIRERKRIKRQTLFDSSLENDVADSKLAIGKGEMNRLQQETMAGFGIPVATGKLFNYSEAKLPPAAVPLTD